MGEGKKEERPKFVSSYLKTFSKYFLSMVVLIVNLLAVSIALNCNKDRNMIVRAFIAVFAFVFSLPYLFIHFVRIVIFNKERCTFDNVTFFG